MTKKINQFLILLAASVVAYFPVLGQKTMNPDAHLILPGLLAIKNPFDYLQMVATFNTVDFQPVRDLTFFFDLFIFHLTGLYSFATINVLIWTLSGFFLLKFLERIVPEERRKGALLWVVLFLVWPLFTQAVPWGMARKHLLAFLFILMATDYYFEWMEGKKNWIVSYLAYVAAGLSHPLVLFWPVWAFLHTRLSSIAIDKDTRKKFILFGITMIVLLLTNYAYYTIGNEVVAENYWKLKPDYFNFKNHFLRLGFSFRQIAFPYKFGFLYWPDIQNAWGGFPVLALLGFIGWHYRSDHKIFSWFFFMVMSFPITLTLENFFDQYLIIPAASVLILFFYLFHRKSKRLNMALITISVCVGTFTVTQAALWPDEIHLTKRNFANYPTCKNATNYAGHIYDAEKTAPIELLQYMEKNNCIVINPLYPAGQFRNNVFMMSRILFYESDKFSMEDRLMKLSEMGRLYYYPQMVYATLLARLDQPDDVEATCADVLKKTGDTSIVTETIMQKHLRPYCELKHLKACLKLTDSPPKDPVPY